MQEHFPLVSIIITSYNRATSIGKAIESSLVQDYPNLEIVISDNCSTDDTDSVVQQYVKDPRVKYYRRQENIGMLGNFRKATYELSKGDYITYVNSDDYLIDNSFVSDAVKLTIGDNKMCLVFGRMCVKALSSGYVWKMPEKPYFTNPIWNGNDVFLKSPETVLLSWGCCMMKREYMLKVKTFHAEYHNFDLESNYKMMLLGNVGFINRPCYIQVVHDANEGYPVNSGKIIQSMQCYENVESFALEIIPERAEEIRKWKDHFTYSLICFTFHILSERNKSEYKIFKREIREKYPEHYKRFVSSFRYKRMLFMNAVKRIVPRKFIRQANILRYKLKLAS